MRISGLASGFDTDEMVRNLMRVERMRVDRFTQRKQVNTWRQERYNAINKDMANFILNSKKNMGLNKVSSTGLITGNSFKNLDYVKKASSYDEDVASVKVVGQAANGKFDIEIEQLAKDATYASGEGIKSSDKLESDLVIDGVTIAKEGTSIKDALNNLNSGKFVSKLGVDASKEEKEAELKLHNEFKDRNITGFLDGKTGRIFIQGMPGENEGSLRIEGLSGLGKGEEIFEAGRLGRAKINGVVFDGLNSNKLDFNGLEIDMKSVGKTTIEVSTNTQGIVDKVKELVDDYNSMLDKIALATSEKRHPNYHPLSAEEKKEMTEDDIKLWEEKAKSGMLNNDETLNRIVSKMRNDLYKDIEGLENNSFKNIMQLGITTEKYSKGATGGKLQIDENKLRAAIEEDAEGVMEVLFASENKDVDTSQKGSGVGVSNKGAFTGVYDNLIEGMRSIIDKSGPGEDSDLFRDVKSNILIDFVTKKGSISDIDKMNNDIEKEIANLERLLIKKEDAYYAQFTQMEKYVYEMNSQSNWLMQQTMM